MLRLFLLVIIIIIAKTTIVITNPLVTDFPNNTLEYYYANFGQVPYGKSLSFDLIVLDNGLCNLKGLEKLKKPTYIAIKTNYHDVCSYTKRSLIAQEIGAKGIIIADTSTDYVQQTSRAIQADDGNGKKVHITTLFITTKSFRILQKLKKVEISVKFPIPKAKVSSVSLFISAAKRNAYVFLRQFREQYKQLKAHIKFEPIYHTINCPNCPAQNCYFDYCSFDFENYQTGVGQKIIKEQIQQYSIYTQIGIQKWFDYMSLFDQYCDGNWDDIQHCNQNIKTKLNLQNYPDLSPNGVILATLRQWKAKEVHLGFDGIPQIAINGMIYRGNFNIEDISLTICQSLQKPPKFCKQKIENKQANSSSKQKSKHKNVAIILVTTITVLLAIVLTGMICYRRCIKNELTRDMASKVGEIIANYASKMSKSKKQKDQQLVQVADEL